MVTDKEILEMSDTEYKRHEKSERQQEKMENRIDRMEQRESDRRLSSSLKSVAKAYSEKEKNNPYKKIQKNISKLKFKIPSRGIKIRRAEPQPQQKSYFKPVQQRSSYFGRTRI